MAVPNLMQIRPWGLLGKCVKYNKIFIYLFIYLFILLLGTVDGFSRLMAQTTRTRARLCLLHSFVSPQNGSKNSCGFRWYFSPFWYEIPQTPIFRV